MSLLATRSTDPSWPGKTYKAQQHSRKCAEYLVLTQQQILHHRRHGAHNHAFCVLKDTARHKEGHGTSLNHAWQLGAKLWLHMSISGSCAAGLSGPRTLKALEVVTAIAQPALQVATQLTLQPVFAALLDFFLPHRTSKHWLQGRTALGLTKTAELNFFLLHHMSKHWLQACSALGLAKTAEFDREAAGMGYRHKGAPPSMLASMR